MKIGILTKPEPHCPKCGAAPMKLRRPKERASWSQFWGCGRYPDCDGTRGIDLDGKPIMDEEEV